LTLRTLAESVADYPVRMVFYLPAIRVKLGDSDPREPMFSAAGIQDAPGYRHQSEK